MPLWPPSVLNDELALVDLFLVNNVRVYTVPVSDHLPGEDRADRAAAVDPYHDHVVEVDLLAFGEFVECHRVAALHGHTDLHILGTFQVLLDELGQEQSTAVEGPGRLCKFLGVGDQHGCAS